MITEYNISPTTIKTYGSCQYKPDTPLYPRQQGCFIDPPPPPRHLQSLPVSTIHCGVQQCVFGQFSQLLVTDQVSEQRVILFLTLFPLAAIQPLGPRPKQEGSSQDDAVPSGGRGLATVCLHFVSLKGYNIYVSEARSPTGRGFIIHNTLSIYHAISITHLL